MAQKTVEYCPGRGFADPRGGHRITGPQLRASIVANWGTGNGDPIIGSPTLPIQILKDDKLLLEHITRRVQLQAKQISPSDRALAKRMGLFSTLGKEGVSNYSTSRTVEQYAHALGVPADELINSISRLGRILDMGAGLGGLATSWALSGGHKKAQVISADVRYADPNFVDNIHKSDEFKGLLSRMRSAVGHLAPGIALKKMVESLEYFRDNSIACMAHHVPLPDNSVGGVIDLKAAAYCTDRYEVTPPRDYGYILGEYIRLTTPNGLIAVNTLTQPAWKDSVGQHIINNTWGLPYEIVLETQIPQSTGTAVDHNFFLRVGRKD